MPDRHENDPLGLFHHHDGTTWVDMIEDLAGTAWESVRPPADDVLQDWLMHLRRQGLPGALDLDAAVWAVVFGALSFGVRYGFGLARSWPSGVDELDRWPAQAWARGQIDGWVASQKQQDQSWRPGHPGARRKPEPDDAA